MRDNNTGEKQNDDDQPSKIIKLDLNQLKVLHPLGRGAKGVVFHIQLESSGEDLALKTVLKSSIESKREKRSNVFEEQVLRELNHPLLPKLRGVLETDHIFGYAIDYCPGGDLNSLRKQQVDMLFSNDVIRFYAAELILALEYLHKKGIVYRDLKPENVLIQENGHLMLVDFDLSTKLVTRSRMTRTSYEPMKKTQLQRFYPFCNSPANSVTNTESSPSNSDTSDSHSLVKSNSFVGTEEYVAPEIIQGNGHDFSVDWWSLGVVLYEMMYGTTPFRGANKKETFNRIVRKPVDLPGETTPLRDLIRQLLEKDPNGRISLEEIKGHDFFTRVDWEMIVRLLRPPFIPIRPNVEEGMGGMKAHEVESFVHGIFKKEDINNNNNNNNNKINEENKNNGNIYQERVRGVWVDGLNKPSTDNFLFF